MSNSNSPATEFTTKNYCHTTAIFKQCEYTWKIDHYKTLHDKLGVEMVSPAFSADNDDLKWKLTVDPKCNYNNVEYVVIGVRLCVEQDIDRTYVGPIALKLDVILETDNNNSRSAAVVTRDLSFVMNYPDPCCCGIRFCSRKKFLTDSEGYLPNDTLTIIVFFSFARSENIANICNPSNSISCEISSHSRLTEDLRQLLVDEEFSDATISLGKKTYPVHKAILATRSSVFKAMFKQDMQERKTNHVNITDIDPQTFEEMLSYIYTGKLTKLDELAFYLLSAADKYDLKELRIMCEQELYKKLSVDNAVDILILADLHHADQLKEQTLRFIKTQTHGTNTMDPDVWNELSTSHPHLLKDMLAVFVKK